MKTKPIYILAWLGGAFSIWYIALAAYEWLTLQSDIDFFYLLVSRIFYILPKLGVILGLVALYKLKHYAFHIYATSWLLAMGHTVIYYGLANVVLHEYEVIKLVLHHVIPHAYFIIFLVVLFKTNQLTNRSSSPTKAVGLDSPQKTRLTT